MRGGGAGGRRKQRRRVSFAELHSSSQSQSHTHSRSSLSASSLGGSVIASGVASPAPLPKLARSAMTVGCSCSYLR
jgi:hypothetical protein